ncbi:hypothetical protein ABZ404_23340 [Streptomyces sp. NPDC005878]|uniref:hypothetical protein n=1 Tax=Streptomyces sp. NPDC005878 TaxID=3157077 RepID=UPI0033FC1CC0
MSPALRRGAPGIVGPRHGQRRTVSGLTDLGLVDTVTHRLDRALLERRALH